MKRAFTLIELMVVISIVGLLAAVVLVSVGSARKNAQDAKEIAHIKQLSNAAELYYVDVGEYPHAYTGPPPHTCGFETLPPDVCIDCIASDPDIFFKQLDDKGINVRNQILQMAEDSFFIVCYFYSNDLQRYKFVSRLNSASKMANDGGINDDFYEFGNDLTMPFIDDIADYPE